VQLGLDGKSHKIIKIDFSKIAAKQKVSEVDWNHRLHCKTALLLKEMADESFIYFACSRGRSHQPNTTKVYKDKRGVSGVVLRFKLKSNGDLPENYDKYFLTSLRGAKDGTGFDTGVYNVGAQITSFKNSLLLATANGPVAFNEENYGCSIVRLKDDLTVFKKNERKQVITIFGDNSTKCWDENIEFTNSPPNIMKLGPNKYLAISFAKNGTLYYFDPDEFDEKSYPPKKIDLGGRYNNYGKVLTAKVKGSYFVYAISFNKYKKYRPGIHAFEYNRVTEKLERRWNYELPEGYMPSRNHAIISQDYKGKNGVVIFTAHKSNKDNLGKIKSTIYFVDVGSGKLKSKLNITGEPHFSTILVHNKFLIVTTRPKGMSVFKQK